MLKVKASEIAQKNTELREKLQILAKKIEIYRQDEDGIKKALLSAQKLGNASLKEAKMTADHILEDANAKADEMIEEAKKKTSDMVADYNDKILGKQKEFDTIKEEVTNFRASLFELYRNHITDVEEIPDFSKDIKAKREARRIEEIKKAAAVAQRPAVKPEPKAVVEQQTIVAPPVVAPTTVAPTPAPVAKPVQKPAPAPVKAVVNTAEIEELDEIKGEMFTTFNVDEISIEDHAFAKADFPEIDFNAYSNIPEALKKEKSEFFNTLEFGENIDIRKN